MGVYIPNLDVPETCAYCPLAKGYDIPLGCGLAPGVPKLVLEFDDAVASKTRVDWCPLVEVPAQDDKKTNGDLLRSMDNEALADELLDVFAAFYCVEWSKDAILKWLNTEVE